MHVVRWLVAVLLAGSITAPARAQADAPAAPSAQGIGAGNAVAPLRRTVTLELRDVPLVQVIQAIDQQADLRLGYTDRLPHLDKHVSIVVTDMPAGEALAKVLEGTGIVVRTTKNGQITLVRDERTSREAARADSVFGKLWGRVADSVTGRPLAGAVVSVEGTGLTFVTNDSGYYWFMQAPAGLRQLNVRLIGYRSARVMVVVSATIDQRTDVLLSMSTSQLQQVVVTATGPQRRMEIGSDLTILNVDSIAATQPIRSVSDLLATRVPGLTAIRTSGAPGDPMRLRLRGAHSVLLSNDPIVIVDGVRVYAAQSAERSGNLAVARPGSEGGYNPPTPSPIDQIDPNSIESIEVVKGPSAATLYGQDAANGVIVITTKHGRAGPARWSAHVDYGQTTMPGSYPVAYYRWGHPLAASEPVGLCRLRDQTCALDSVSRFQLLNVPAYTVLGHGDRTAGTLGVSGGTASVTYSVSGSLSDETGLLTLPDYAAARFQRQSGSAPPGWMVHPHHYRTWSANTGLHMQIGSKADVSLQALLSRGAQQRSDLESQLGMLMRTYFDSSTGSVYIADGNTLSLGTNDPFDNFYRRVTDQATTFTNGASLNWRPLRWLTANANAGINYESRDDRLIVPRGLIPSGPDTVGRVGVGKATTLMRTVGVGATATAPLPRGFLLRTAIGANYASTSTQDFALSGKDLPPGMTSIRDAHWLDPVYEARNDIATFGWFIEPSISNRRFWLTTGLRLDGGSTFGTRVKLPSFPKLSLSYLISDEPFFPFKSVFNTLRLRVAYGHSGQQPGPADRLRLYQQHSVWVDSETVAGTVITTLGNTQLKPERSRELEGGFDADLFDSRVSIAVTGYRRTTLDALMRVPVPPSVYDVDYVLKNVGVTRNTGLELQLGLEPLRTDLVTWRVDASLSHEASGVVSLAPGVSSFFTDADGRIAAGYPLFGRWARPIIGYEDVNHDGLIEGNEVQVGDSLVYMGASEPNYVANFSTTMSFFRGRLSVDAGFQYKDGLTQINEMALKNQIFSPALNDPNAPFGQQAAVAAMDRTTYGEMQTVSTLRFNSLAVTYTIPAYVARRLGAQALSISLQGSNLGLFTNYRGKDPDVNAYGSGNGVLDTGVLPEPRTWSMRVSASY